MLGFHMMSMEEFLTKEGATGGLNPSRLLLPKNDTTLWGRDLWFYLNKVADLTPCKCCSNNNFIINQLLLHLF